VAFYARLLGLGERATLENELEQPGTFPTEEPKHGGVGMLSSFGEGILLSPLQLASMLSAIANGGTLYYLQHPKTEAEIETFVPRVKRRLDIETWIPEITPGMMGAVAFGTARRAGYDPEEPIYGKTGTCTDRLTPTHLGWFGSFNRVEHNKLVVVVLLTGGKPVNGPVAAGIAGNVYKSLSEQQYFAHTKGTSPVALVGTRCCAAQ
jgi:cell division protein FtsI/penicillin-binding protein 2